jgi:sugar phosphate isomerase/epimerase
VKPAISNIALTAYDHGNQLKRLSDIGLKGLEVAPSRVWHDTWHDLRSSDISTYRQLVETSGLEIIGLHSLFYDHPELGLFKDVKARADTLDFMQHLSGICRDLGGTTLIYGGGRKRGDLPLEDAFEEAISFFGELSNRIEDHGTVFCFEPLGPDDTDFINTVSESIRIVTSINSPSLRVQLDAKALVENGDVGASVFDDAKPFLVHYHANEPGLGVLGSTGDVDHALLGTMLKAIDYEGYVSIEQRMIGEDNPLLSIADSMQILKDCYL